MIGRNITFHHTCCWFASSSVSAQTTAVPVSTEMEVHEDYVFATAVVHTKVLLLNPWSICPPRRDDTDAAEASGGTSELKKKTFQRFKRFNHLSAVRPGYGWKKYVQKTKNGGRPGSKTQAS